jgi:hypothetical protein
MVYKISGTVACCGGYPVENATIVIDDKFALSDENGNFVISNITPGNHEIQVVHRKYQTLSTQVDVNRNIENAILYIKYIGR